MIIHNGQISYDFLKYTAWFVNMMCSKAFTKHYTFELPTKAIPTDNFLFIPPDSILPRTCLLSGRPIDSIIRSTSSCISLLPSIPFKLVKNIRCSSTVKLSNKTLCCGHIPEIKIWVSNLKFSCYKSIIDDHEMSKLLYMPIIIFT